jgi:hypothetical protein
VRVHQLPIGSDAGAEVLYNFMKKNRSTTVRQDDSKMNLLKNASSRTMQLGSRV